MKGIFAAASLVTLVASCSMADESLATSEQALASSTLVARRATWWCWYDGVDRGTYWRQFGWQPEAGVTSATVPVGYGEPYVTNTFSFGPDPAHKPITGYFRKDFYVADPAQFGRLRLELMYDDGMVFYVNGREGGRDSLPAGPIAYSTLAYSHEANATFFGFDATPSIADLHPGWNTLAIEIHQESPSSSDLVFDAALVAFPRAAGTRAIAPGADWSYDERGAAPAGWNQPGFDDSTWPRAQAPLGYGESYLANTLSFGPDPAHKPRATYFRRTFLVDDPPRVQAIFADVLFDDGFVAYLNGHEVARDFMPLGTVNGATLAWNHEAGPSYAPYELSAGLAYLKPGQNVLAVEVHQNAESSSDLVFDLGLTLPLAPGP
jgi:hypothetical protein